MARSSLRSVFITLVSGIASTRRTSRGYFTFDSRRRPDSTRMCLGRVVSVAAVLVLIGAGTLAGVASTVAALASLVSYPALLALGLPPVSANVTNTVALVFTGA